jgi:hypothetical protein
MNIKSVVMFALLGFGGTQSVHALPIVTEYAFLNEKSATLSYMHADHLDKSVVYLIPQDFQIKTNDQNVPMFQFKGIEGQVHDTAIVSFTLENQWNQKLLEEVKKEVLEKAPNTKFKLAALENIKVQQPRGSNNNQFYDGAKGNCNYNAMGLYADLTCVITLEGHALKDFERDFEAKGEHWRFFEAVIKGMSSAGKPTEKQAGFVLKINTSELLKHRQLFVDANGEPLPLED